MQYKEIRKYWIATNSGIPIMKLMKLTTHGRTTFHIKTGEYNGNEVWRPVRKDEFYRFISEAERDGYFMKHYEEEV
jgi:hypothetical protein